MSKSYKSATLLFRREVQSMLSTPLALPAPLPANAPVEVVACLERLSTSGMQQSVQLCRAGEEEWVTRTEGERAYFPRVARVQKRARAAAENEEDDAADQDTEQEPPTSSSSARRAAPASPTKKQRTSDGGNRHANADDGAATERDKAHRGRRAPQNPSTTAGTTSRACVAASTDSTSAARSSP
ncbi:hypothetical protein JCM21900_006541 [Sporobolomyces salmonicolor]